MQWSLCRHAQQEGVSVALSQECLPCHTVGCRSNPPSAHASPSGCLCRLLTHSHSTFKRRAPACGVGR